ncbi:P-loop NTPase fold protein [Tardiphaga sp.]|jgi:type II secretory pathway predicted ATPase ExeA|uniref:P-loop NTPase fold protein n=1 Tax=Tardiphaga sp. TaxID=1926292 RepID=UPI0037DA654E
MAQEAIETTTVSGVPNFRNDEAASVDFFGSHERVASAISQVITSSAKSNIIGLIGSWGSGKSTIVRLLEQQLTKSDATKSFCFFNYDAWLHQSDGPRRSFLESFIAYLVSINLTTTEQWREDLDRLSKRRDDSEVTTTPTLSLPGKLIALSLLPAALGWKLADKTNAYVWGTCWPLQYVGFGLISLPAFAALGAYLYERPERSVLKGAFYKKSNFTTNRSPDSSTVFSIFVNKAVQQVKTRTMRTPEPTALEFQKVFKKIISSVSASNRSFVFIIDNLDRIPETEAIAIWATIRSFFMGDSGAIDNPGADSALTVVLPLDLSAIRRIYGKEETQSHSLAEAFIEKTFDLVFHVNPPTQSGWHDYMESRLKSTIPEIEPEEVFSVINVYRLHVEAKNEGVTPRNINSFTNGLAVLYMQWKGEIAVATLAHYALYRANIAADPSGYLATDQRSLKRTDPAYAESIAAIHYGVRREDALQVLIAPRISAAITSEDASAFAQLAKVRGFETVLLRHIESTSSSNGASRLRFASTIASLLERTTKEKVPVKEEIHASLRHIFTDRTSAWGEVSELSSSGIEALVANCPGKDRPPLLSSIIESLAEDDLGNATEVPVKRWKACFDTIVSSTKKFGHKQSRIASPDDPAFLMELLDNYSTSDPSLKWLTSASESSDIGLTVAANAEASKFEARFSARLEKLIVSSVSFDWSKPLQTAKSFVESHNVSDDGFANAVDWVGLANSRAALANSKQHIEPLTTSHLLDRIYQAQDAKQNEALASMLALTILINPKFSIVTQVGNGEAGRQRLHQIDGELPQGSELLTLLDSKLRRYGRFRDLFAAAQANGEIGKIFRKIFEKRLIARDLGPLHLEEVIPKFSGHASFLPDELKQPFARELQGYEGFWSKFEDYKNSRQAEIILSHLVELEGDAGTKARAMVYELSEARSAEDWKETIEEYDYAYLALESSVRVDPKRFVFGDALQKSIQEIIETKIQESEPDDSLARAFFAAQMLDDVRREFLFRGIRDLLLNGVHQPGAWHVLKHGGGQLLSLGQFKERSDESVRHLVIPMLEKSAEFAIFAEEHTVELRKWKEGAAPATKTYLRTSIVDALKDTDRSDELKRIAQALRMRIKESDEPGSPE